MTSMLRLLIGGAGEFSKVGVTVFKRLLRTRIGMQAVVESNQRITSRFLDS